MDKEIRLALAKTVELRDKYNKAVNSGQEGMSLAEKEYFEKFMEADKTLLELLTKEPPPPEPVPKDLQGRIELRRYLMAYGRGSRVDGAERELNQGLKLADDRHIPLEALLPLETEARTDDATNVTQGDFGRTVRPIMPRIFEQTDAAWLGVSMPAVAAGTQVYPVMTGGTSATTRSPNVAVEADAATFTTSHINPTRLSARYKLNLEGVAEMGAQLESTLRADMRMVMGDQLDEQILNGDGTAPNVSGILNELTAASDPSGVATWDTYRNLSIDALDGKMARSEGGVRFLVGLDTYKHARKTFAVASATAAEGIDGVEAIRGTGASVRSSVKMPAIANKFQTLLQIIEAGAAVAPIWQGMTVIRDPYTNAASAQVALTAHILFGFGFRRKDGWKRLKLQVQS